MSAVGTWRARAYWVLACGLLPLLNPVALAVITIPADMGGPPWPLIAICITLVNGLLLGLAAVAIWKRPDDVRWRIGLGLVLAIALSIPYGFGELLLFLDITCPESGCFD
jgi:hypothetical protein